MKITSKRFGYVLGVIAANLFSPSFLLMPVYFHFIAKVIGLNIDEALKSPDAAMLIVTKYLETSAAHPIQVFLCLMGCAAMMVIMSTIYTYLLARLGGRMAVWCESAIQNAQISLTLPKFFPTNNTVASLD